MLGALYAKSLYMKVRELKLERIGAMVPCL